MVNYVGAELDSIFGALSDPTRRNMIDRLSRGDLSVSQLAEPLDMSLPAVSKHLSVLQRAGLVEQHKSGRTRLCTFCPEPLKAAEDWVSRYQQFWTTALDSLNRYLTGGESSGKHND
jgi:DNA-binding transcriptional ArsR family regulator